MLVPKRAKYRKQFTGRMKGISLRGSQVNFGEFGLRAMEPGWISSRQIEAARRAMTRYTRSGGRVYIRIAPDKPITKKPAETRMGGGRGEVQDYVAVVRPGRILFEMVGITEAQAKEALARAGAKLSVACKFVLKV